LSPDKPLSSQLHRAFGKGDGLPSAWINDVVQTRDGFFWIATDNGLARYDGWQFEVFDRTNTPQLPHREMRVLCEDSHGHLWIGTTHGLARFVPGKPGVFEMIEGIPGTVVHAIYEDKSRTLWVGTQDRTYAGTLLGKFQPCEAAPTNVRAICVDKNDRLWLGANTGLFRREGTSYVRVAHERLPLESPADSSVPYARVNALLEDASGDLWIGTNRTLLHMHEGEFVPCCLELGSQQVYDIRQALDGGLYVAARFGVYRTDGESKLEQVSDRVSNFCICEDRDGRLWIGQGDNRGLHCYGNNPALTIWNEASTRCLFEDSKGGFWLGTGQGLYRVTQNGPFVIEPVASLSDLRVQTIFSAKDGPLWIGTDEGLRKTAAGEILNHEVPATSEPLNVSVGCEDSRGVVWLGLTVAGGRTIRGQQVYELPTLKDGRIHWFWEHTDGSIWIGHESGLYRGRNPDDIQRLKSDAFEELQHPRMLCHADTLDGGLWIGTSNGLLRYREGQFIAIPTEAGLQADNIERLAADRQGNLWFGGRDGLFYLDAEQLDDFLAGRASTVMSAKIEGFERFPPLNAFSQGCLVKDDTLWILAESGLVQFPMGPVLCNSEPPQVIIESASVDGREMRFDQEFQYVSGNHRLSIQFAAPSFQTMWPVQLRYRLVGHDHAWNDASHQRSAEYTSLEPGDYRFLVAARVGKDPWPQAASSLLFRVNPRWWETRWFVALVPSVLMFATFGLTWQFVRQARQRNRILQRQIDQRQRVEQMLRSSESRFRELAESTRAVPWEADAQSFRITYIGKQVEEVLGYPAAAWLQEGFWQKNLYAQDHSRVIESYRHAVQIGEDFQIDYRIPAADGRLVHLHDVVHVVREDGLVCKLSGFMIDISAARANEEKVRTSLRRLARLDRIASMGEMAATVAHEVNQPLFAIVSNAETALRLLARETGGGTASESAAESLSLPYSNLSNTLNAPQTNMQIVREALEDIVSDGNRASQIIGHVRSRVRKQSHSPVPIDLNRITREAADFAEREIRRRGLTLRLQLEDNLPAVTGNVIELQQVMLNFLINAVQACESLHEASEIVLKTTHVTDRVILSVADRGEGIDGARAQQLFEPFFTTKVEGMGIGLAVSRTIIESYGGKIWATANSDRGATFYFSLPVITEASE
jgi:PAS domain S-box-containing protein